ncbi:hypothetical protein FEM48_Zijuj09G0086700 [Ziziphus jujuba var. spinosa]|uniref:methylmalonate-semialdehyde dehydrogenase (CoA acylating) n=1 Tax=Ziziphus jujuba var. spinosa TaxID=714518 RepID=A0A978URZ6_ZIZJJ|nr:hypothetical protein FEM48_Zijuj09G0086700 [Ziziphus jujuba var. spinosa]
MLGNSKHVAVFAFPFDYHAKLVLNLVCKLATAIPEAQSSFFTTTKSNHTLFSPSQSHFPPNLKPYTVGYGVPAGHEPPATYLQSLDLLITAAPKNFEMGADSLLTQQVKSKFHNLFNLGFLIVPLPPMPLPLSDSDQTEALEASTTLPFLWSLRGNLVDLLPSGPFFGDPDHKMTAKMMEEVWEVGVRIEGGVSTKSGLVKSFELFLGNQRGKMMKKNAEALKEDIVNAITDDDDIRSVSFVGFNTQSNSASCFACLAGFLIFILLCLKAAMHIYGRASAKGKRVQSNMGAKNHAIVLSDASEDAALNAIVAAGFGAAGQRCMALSTAVFVEGELKV